MKKLFIIAFIACSTPSVFGQIKEPKSPETTPVSGTTEVKKEDNSDDFVINKPTFQRFDNKVVADERYEGIKGNRYFYDEKFHEGALVMTKKREFGKDMLFKFDQLEGTILMKYPDGKEVLVDQNEILNFNLFIDDKAVVFVRMKLPNSVYAFNLVQVIYYSPNFKLIRDARKKLKRVENTGAYSSNQIYDQFENDYHYYLKRGSENLVEVKPTAKSFSKAMPDKAAKIESLFKAAKGKGELSVSKLAEIFKKLDDAVPAEKTN